jgi:uncharacterized protein YoxC
MNENVVFLLGQRNVVVLPDWYLALSVFMMALVMFLFVGLCFLVWKLYSVINAMQPKVTSLTDKVNNDVMPKVNNLIDTVNSDVVPKVSGLITTVEGLTHKVEGLTERAQGVVDSAKGVVDSAKGTVDSVGNRVQGLTGTVEGFANVASERFQKAAPLIGLVAAGLRLYTMFQQSRGQKPGRVRIEKKPDALAVTVDPGEGSDDGSHERQPKGDAVQVI